MIASGNPRSASRLGKLPVHEQQAVFAHCEGVTLEDGVRWLETEFNIRISENRLSAWLRRRREQQSILAPNRKVRPDSPLNLLPPEQQDNIYSQCEGMTLDEGLRWLKTEFNIDATSYGLGKWLVKRRNDKAMEARLEEIREDRDRAMLLGNAVGAVTAITDANSVLFAQAIFEEFRKPPGERDEARLVKYMTLALKARAVELAYNRFHFDAAKRAMEQAADLQRIRDGGGDEREKIEKAIQVLFGERPANTTFNPIPAA